MPIQFGQLFVEASAVDPAWTCFLRKVNVAPHFAGLVTVSSAPVGGSNEIEINPVDPTQTAPTKLFGCYSQGEQGTWLLRIDGEIGQNETKVATVSCVKSGTVFEQRIKFL